VTLRATPAAVVGRFAPSPTGPLHAGSLVAALASWLDARARSGRWLVRIEDVDAPRCLPGMGQHILQQLAACALVPDGEVLWQQQRDHVYAQALQRLLRGGLAYPCACSRRDIEAVWQARGQPHQRFEPRIYPGTCSSGLHGPAARAVRLRVQGVMHWQDRWLGAQQQDLAQQVGDFVLCRLTEPMAVAAEGQAAAPMDGPTDAPIGARTGNADAAEPALPWPQMQLRCVWTYQLAVVVDDADQGITDVVRGADLLDNTARQIWLQQRLGLPTPRYLHTPLVLAADGHKLSKQNGAAPLVLAGPGQPLLALRVAADVLHLPALTADPRSDQPPPPLAEWLAQAVNAWAGMIRGSFSPIRPFQPGATPDDDIAI